MRIKGELLCDPFCGVHPPENGTIATDVLLLRLIALRHCTAGRERTDPGLFEPYPDNATASLGESSAFAWKEGQPGLCSDLNP
jgi:hypothetical protein